MADTSTVDDLRRAMESLTESYREQTEEQRVRAAAEDAVIAKSRAVKENAVKAGQQAVTALGSFGKSLLSTEAGMSKYNSGINSAGNAALSLGKAFGPLGIAVGGLVKLFTMGMELVAKQNDAMIKAYDTLSEFGQTAKFTTTDILNLGKASGYTSHNLEIFTKNAAKVSQELAGLTGSASAGLKAFSDLTAVTQEQRNQYNRLGISQEKLTEGQTYWVKQSLAGGTSIVKNADEQRKASLKYIDAQLELAALTGIDVKKQQDLQDAVNADINFQQYKYNQDRKIQSLKEDAAKQDDSVEGKARKEKLLGEASALREDTDKRNRIAIWANASLDAAQSTAVNQMMSSKNMDVLTEQTGKLATAGVDFQKVKESMAKGGTGIGALASEFTKAEQRFGSTLGEVAAMTGEGGKSMRDAFGLSTKSLQVATTFQDMTTKEGVDAYEKNAALSAEELAKKRLGIGMLDLVKDTQNKQLTVELQARQALDEFAKDIKGPVTAAFRGLLSVMNSFGKAVGKIISWIPGWGDTGKKIMDQFRDPEEIKDQMKKAENEKKALNKQITDEEELNKEKVADYRVTAEKEKKTKQDLYTADAMVTQIREKQAKATTQEEKDRLKLEMGTALVNQSNTKAAHEVERKALESKKIQNPAAYKIIKAKERITELDQETASNQESLDRLSGKTGKKAEDRTIDDDKDVIAARELLQAQKILYNAEIEKKIKETFEAENKGLVYSAEAAAKVYNDEQKAKDFKERVKAKLKPLDDKITALTEANKKLELAKQEKLNKEKIAEAQATIDKSGQNRGLEAAKNNAMPNKLADLVSSGESKGAGNYNAANYSGGKKAYKAGEKDLVGMTIGDLKKAQSSKEIFAAGRYQIVPKTMLAAIDALGLKDTDKFDEAMQDRIFKEYLVGSKRPEVKGFLSGEKGADINKAVLAMAKEFASIGVPEKIDIDDNYGKRSLAIGDSYYAGVGGNPKGKAQITPDQVKEALLAEAADKPGKEQTARFGGVFAGPNTGYPVTLHGREAVVPIPNPNNVLAANGAESVQKNDLSTVMQPQAAPTSPGDNGLTTELFYMLAEKMDMMIDKLAASNDIQDELLRYSRA